MQFWGPTWIAAAPSLGQAPRSHSWSNLWTETWTAGRKTAAIKHQSQGQVLLVVFIHTPEPLACRCFQVHKTTVGVTQMTPNIRLAQHADAEAVLALAKPFATSFVVDEQAFHHAFA